MPYADTLLATNERIIRRERQHWMFPLLVAGRWVAIAAIIGVLGFLLTQLTGGDGLAGIVDQILTWGTVIALAFAAIGLVWSIIQWQTQEYVLSDRRVMHVHGVINKQSSDASLENITDAQITVPWLGRIMGFGDLIFLTAAEAGMQNLKTLKAPIEFKKDLMDAKHERMIEINTPRVASPPIRTDAAPVAPTAPVAPVEPAAPPREDPEELTRTLTSLAALRDSGAITPEEYEAKKAELLARL
jgi:uncharacterized membrane protein YdbT with pleckstrin-like domain